MRPVVVDAVTPTDAWVEVVKHCLASVAVEARGLATLEIEGPVTVLVREPCSGFVGAGLDVGRKFNHAVSVVEGLSFVGQTSFPEMQTERVKTLGRFQNQSVFRGAYGSRAESQLDDIVATLRKDRGSRQAVLSIYDGHRDLGRWGDESKSGDVPCTLTIQFRGREEATGPEDFDTVMALDAWVSMRSNDAWMGLPYDMGQFNILHVAMAQALGWNVGYYWHTAGSMHLYSEHWEAADKVGLPRQKYRPMTTTPGFGCPPGAGLAEIASRARRLLRGEHLTDATRWELLLMQHLGRL